MAEPSPRRALVAAVAHAKQKIVAYQRVTTFGERPLSVADDLHNATVRLWQAAESYLKAQKGAKPNPDKNSEAAE